jgi:hypothetical protein
VKRTGLDRFVAASYGAQPQVNRQVEEAIVAYRREASARVAQAMPAQALTLAKDETSTGGLCLVAMAPKSHDLILEQAAPARAQDTWQARMAPALSGLNCQGIPSTRDAAPGLLAYVAQHLGAQHSPDVFHGQHELGKAVSGPRATQPRAAPKAATAAPERREHGQEPLQGAGNAPENRGPGRPPQATARLAPLAQEAHAAHQACERLSAQRAQVAQRIRAIGPASHGVAGERGGRRNGTRIAADSQAQIERVRTVAQHEGLSQSGVDRRGQAERVGPKRQATIACVSGDVRQQVAQLDLTPPASYAMPAQLMPSFSLERVARTRTESAGEPCRKLAEGLRTALCAPGGALAKWSEAEQSALQQQAPELAEVFQRSSANVAGRNGSLSLRHHQLRG